MNPLIGFFTVISMAAFIGIVMVAVFLRPIRTMLSEACATEARSLFWTTYLCALFILVPMVAASVFATFSSRYIAAATLIEGTFLFAAGGLLAALIIIGRNISSALGSMMAPLNPTSQDNTAADEADPAADAAP